MAIKDSPVVCVIAQKKEKSNLACKSLFGKSDPSETRKMLNAALDREAKRLMDGWNFDPNSAKSAENRDAIRRQIPAVVSKSVKRYEWELQDSKAVPHFYIRPFRKHHSERLRESRRQRLSPLPLSQRDQNSNPATPSKQIEPTRRLCTGLNFSNPPQIIQTNVNTSLARVVTARRLPAPTFNEIASPKTTVTSPLDDITTCKVTEIPKALTSSQTTVKERPSSATRGSKRQLFASSPEQSKKQRREGNPQQLKITEMLPQKKSRTSSAKKIPDTTRPHTSSQLLGEN